MIVFPHFKPSQQPLHAPSQDIIKPKKEASPKTESAPRSHILKLKKR